jgi:transposase
MKKHITVGVDLGDNLHRYCVLNDEGEVNHCGGVANTKTALKKLFVDMEPSLVVMEAGTHSAWVSAYVRSFGHEVLVANPRKLSYLTREDVKTDYRDAECLARIGRADPKLLKPVIHRSAQAQADLAVLKARDTCVQTRTSLIAQVRSMVKVIGERLPKCSSDNFSLNVVEIPSELKPALEPLVQTIENLSRLIRDYDSKIENLCKNYPETEIMQSVQGVGPITALAFALAVDDPYRFKKSRNVPAYMGLTPRKSQSGDRDPQLRITKAGNNFARRLLVQAAHYILGPFAKGSALRDWGMKLFERGGKNAKKRAVVAVARKLAVMLHRMWITGELWMPYFDASAQTAEAS